MSEFQALNPQQLAGSVLSHIVARRRTHLPQIRAELGQLRADELEPSSRSLYHALGAGERGNARFIMECKAASPSLGLIRDPYQPGQIARVYGRYAAAISVLCEPDFFGGSYDHLASVRANTDLPVLCKDFIIDPLQVIAARYYGADAVLLMLSVLSDAQYRELAQLASQLNLDVLTEVTTVSERERALALGAKIIGINNRNLRDLTVDTTRTLELAADIPANIAVLSESGIRTHADVRHLAAAVSGFLVGSSLTSQPDIDFACRQLVYGNVKVCGLTSSAQAQMVAALGASYGGLILAERSPRYVSAQTAAKIAAATPQLRFVAVTTLTQPAQLREQLRPLAGLIQAVQVHAPAKCDAHGNFDAAAEFAWIEELERELGDVEIWRGLAANRPSDLQAANALAGKVRIVLDSGAGGSGIPFDWRMIPDAIRAQIILAGGIGPNNIQAALREDTCGIDLNSGVEYANLTPTATRRKDPVKVRETLEQIRSYAQPLAAGATEEELTQAAVRSDRPVKKEKK